jgi:hypothetical protein
MVVDLNTRYNIIKDYLTLRLRRLNSMAEQEPFKSGTAGANAFRAAYDRLKSEADLAKQNIGQDYASAYQQLRGQTYTQGLGAAAQQGLSGGQAAGVRGAVSAQQMGALGNLMQGQERATK